MKWFRKFLCAAALILGFALPVQAQYTNVTATVKDASGNLYANCFWEADFVFTATTPSAPTLNGSPFQRSFAGRCNASGVFTVTVADNTQVQPKDATSKWGFNVCDQTGKFCFNTQIVISTASQDISATLQAASVLIPGATPGLVARPDLLAQGANVGSTLLYAVPSNGAGHYSVTCYVVITQAATTSSTLPSCQVVFTDNDTNVTTGPQVLTATNTSNAVGNFGAASVSLPYGGVMDVRASTNINFSTTGYVSTGATPMQYAIHVRLLFLGP